MASRDVSVLSCIPLDQNDWQQRFSSRPCGDFVRFITETRFAGDAKRAWQFFRAEAAFIEKKLASFEASGLAVTRRATCDDIRRAAARRCTDVVLIAHWKGETVLGADVSDPRRVLERLATLGIARSVKSFGEDLRGELQQALNDFLVENGTGAESEGQSSPHERLERRERLNKVPFIAQGNRLEAWDAMLSRADFSELFPSAFDGTLFAVVCTSDLLADTFRRAHGRAMCICSRDPVRAGLTLAKLDAALVLMRARGIPLWKALHEAGDMIDAIAEAPK